MVWVKGNRYDDVTESEPMMFVTVLLPYSIFRFVWISRFVIFLIGRQWFCGSPIQFSPWLGHYPCTAKWVDAVVPCHFCLSQALKGSVNSMCKVSSGTEAIASTSHKQIFEQIQHI
jgi:hypothetical protein